MAAALATCPSSVLWSSRGGGHSNGYCSGPKRPIRLPPRCQLCATSPAAGCGRPLGAALVGRASRPALLAPRAGAGGVEQPAASLSSGSDIAAAGKRASELLQAAADVVSSQDPDLLKALPSDLKQDVTFAAFQLSNGPVDREVGEGAAAALSQLARAFEAGDVVAAGQSAKVLTDEASRLPPGSAARFRLGKRLKSCGRPLASTDRKELQQIAAAFLEAGTACQVGCADEAVPPPPPGRSIRLPGVEYEVTQQTAFVGAATAAVLTGICWRYVSGLSAVEDVSTTQTLYSIVGVAGYFCTLLSGFAAVGLLLLGLQLGASDSTSE